MAPEYYIDQDGLHQLVGEERVLGTHDEPAAADADAGPAEGTDETDGEADQPSETTVLEVTNDAQAPAVEVTEHDDTTLPPGGSLS